MSKPKYGVCAALNGHIPHDGFDPMVGNPRCVCTHPLAAMTCPYGHMLECHYPMTCEEANCDHYQQAQSGEEGAA